MCALIRSNIFNFLEQGRKIGNFIVFQMFAFMLNISFHYRNFQKNCKKEGDEQSYQKITITSLSSFIRNFSIHG